MKQKESAWHYIPQRVFFEEEALAYPLGQKLVALCRDLGLPTRQIPSHNRVTGLPGDTPSQKYVQAKKTLVVGVKRDLRFPTCRPSADYQFPLMTSCPGHCEYCYLQTTLGQRPYLRVYVNVEEMLDQAATYIAKKAPEPTTFEVASSGDPLSVEHLTGSLFKTIEFFGDQEFGRLRFVTKFTGVEPLLKARHKGHTRFRFSLNSERVLRDFEHRTPPVAERIAAAAQVARAGYPLGFIIAPIMVYPGWEDDYLRLFDQLKKELASLQPLSPPVTFELIQHRFTARAKKVILERFPESRLDMDEEKRKFKYGKYGMGKYVYPDETARSMKDLLQTALLERFPDAEVEYFT
ncbi:spore photoproduct lyase [Heliobacterium gestii]|uniref:Spore photoproduct lyase n=1 Tax=Heliomicrobium gestii TaxID=2699 RepID=A0A845LEE5_HELGE|nr:spore photoproduct lyase [Heliomicrobium gestii]MBM7868408.1 spore photoproduct lyase [Heliomicrobium gestii]MZP44538.1 spore photoproduct lyase [Heliomicrobium gestii]